MALSKRRMFAWCCHIYPSKKPSLVMFREREDLPAKVAESKANLSLNLPREVFLDRIQTQEEIHRLIEEVFGDRKRLTLEEFQQINEEVSSEMFLSVS